MLFQEGRREYQTMFWETLNIDYVEIVYKEFDQNITLITKSLIDQVEHSLFKKCVFLNLIFIFGRFLMFYFEF